MSTGNLYQEDDASKLAGELFSGKLGVGEALGKLRTKLLDLTMRNRLLNYRPPKGRSIQFTNDPDLDLLFERLEEGKPVPLLYVPDPHAERYDGGRRPDVRVYARELGIGASVDLTTSSATTAFRRQPALQVLQYPADLERMARKISSEARTVVEETGTNMLYLMFGFLEYYDSEDSEKAIHAPLLSMPVNLVRGNLDKDSRTYTYELSYSGEDIAENFSLREKMRQQFRLELPELDEDDTPQSYFAKMQAAVSKRRNWAVRWRLSLGFLSFGKLAIWADLDPARCEALLSSELLRNVFEGGRAEPSGAFHAEDYVIDSHADGELPLIYDADSSQHSAIIDVKNGKSLVINGPPGTGKSQTITNIIAAAIADGKKVLFVSEKLAALEVVKQRLEAAGLGDFCLELHSHKTQKKQLLESIEQRMVRRYAHPEGYSKRVEVLRERRKALNTYAELLGSQIGNRLALTVHQVLWTAERCRQALDGQLDVLSGLSLAGAAEWTAEQVDRRRMVLGDAVSALQEMGCAPAMSTWVGFRPGLLIKGDEAPVVQVIEEALGHAQALDAAVAELQHLLGGAPWTIANVQARAQEAAALLQSVPDLLDGSLLEQLFAPGLAALPHVVAETQRLSARLSQVRALRARAQVGLIRQDIQHPERLPGIAAAAKGVLILSGVSKPAQELGALCGELDRALAQLRDRVGSREVLLPPDPVGLRSSLQAAAALADTAAWFERGADELAKAGSQGIEVVQEVKSALEQVKGVLQVSRIHFTGCADELQALLDGQGLSELLPDAAPDDAAIEELRRLADGGWRDWTAGRFAAKAREIDESLHDVRDAAEELQSFFARLGIPVETTRAGLEGIEALVAVAEAAPKELLAARVPELARPDFADVLSRAESAHKAVCELSAKIAAAFHLDALPEADVLRDHIRVFRRGDSFFNFLKSDWRQAKASFMGCVREKGRLTAQAMGEQFALALSWRTTHSRYVGNEQFRAALGTLFQGVETDFAKAKQLHAWLQRGRSTLLATDLAQQVDLTGLSEQHVSLLAASALRIRTWLGKLQHLYHMLPGLPGLDPALARARRVEELLAPLQGYARALGASAALVQRIAQPTTSVARVLELAEFKRKLVAHGDLLRSLVAAPARLCEAGTALGLSSSPVSYQNLPDAVVELGAKSQTAQDLGARVAQGLGGGESLRSALDVLDVLQALNVLAGEILVTKDVPLQGPITALVDARQAQVRAVQALAEYLEPYARPDVPTHEVLIAIESALDADATVGAVMQDAAFTRLFGSHLQGEQTSETAIQACIEWATTLQASERLLHPAQAQPLLRTDAVAVAQAGAAALLRAASSVADYSRSMDKLADWGQLDWMDWGGHPMAADAVARLQRAQLGSGSLVSWSKFLAAKDDAAAVGVGELLARVEAGRLAPSSLVQGFELVFYRTLSRGILAAHKELARFSGASHERLRAEFAALDKELIALNGAMYAARIDGAKKPLPGVGTGRAGDLTEMALLSKEVKKQRRHVPIRQLLKRAGRSLQELKPCFMMGPLSVAQYLEQGYLAFDLVVMDEASQLRPEDALGAIARGKQLVVVGDPKQLPPTNFFDRLMGDDDEDADDAHAVIDGAESILGICEHLYRPVRTLRWHYRSRHESLIAFSNSQFYGGRLVVFPAPYQRNKRLGVNYRYIRDGVYQDRRNHPEAERVVDAVIEHMLACPNESLGVVTLNQTQRDLIEDLLDKKIRNVAGVAEYLERHETAGWKFFVKNLENVQGDERDVIFVSTTFGKPPGASVVRQNFGPINRPDGWRRLNVLFTRARRRLDLFTSMLPTDVQVDEKASLGRKALRDYLEFARTGALPAAPSMATGREPDSDFEIAVAAALRTQEFDIEPQVGVAGYFIDIGVRHPQRRGEFLAGIECDGATYHSSLSARDRDRIRQEILESLGWRGRIIRVWSTDWFADPVGQTRRLVQFLEQRLQADQEQPAPYSDEDLDLAPDVEEALLLQSPLTEAVDGASPEFDVLEPGSDGLFVEVGDRVTYETLEEPCEQHTVHIVDSPSNLRLGLLNEETPLAQALLGACVGDNTELRVKGQQPRRMRVLRIDRATAQDGTGAQLALQFAAQRYVGDRD